MDDVKSISKDVLGASVAKDFVDRDMDQVQVELDKALAAHAGQGGIKTSGAWLFVNVGLNAEGKVQGMIGLGGTAATLMMLEDYISDTIEESVNSQGGCMCTSCKASALLRLLMTAKEVEDAPRH